MISIVMPTYGQSKYINQAVDSIVRQTHRDWELIIVLDGEDLPTQERAFSWMRVEPERVRVIAKENGGTGSALNCGFQSTIGQYETWNASDNVMYPQYLEKLWTFLVRNPHVDYVYSNCEIGVMDGTGEVEKQRKLLTDEVGSQVWNRQRTLDWYYFGICWLWRKSLRLKCGEFQKEPCEDYDMVLRMQENGEFGCIPDVLGWFRRHDENMTHKIIQGSKDPHFYSHLVQAKARERRPDIYGVTA